LAADVSIVVKAITGPAIQGFKKLGNEIDRSTSKAEKFGKTQARSLGSKIRGGANMAIGIGGAAGLAGAGIAVKSAIDLNKEMTRTFAILDSQSQKNKFGGVIRNLAGDLGVVEQELAAGGFDIVSAGKFDQLQPILKTAGKLAASTGQSIQEIIPGLLTGMEVFGKSADQVGDKMFATNKAARTTVDTIGKMLGEVGSLFKTVGSEGKQLDELAGIFTALTLKGTGGDKASRR